MACPSASPACSAVNPSPSARPLRLGGEPRSRSFILAPRVRADVLSEGGEMAALDFGLLIHATPRGGTLPAMRETNERLLQAAVEHDLTAWFVDHFQIDDQFLLECFAFLAHTAGRYPGLRTGTLVLGQAYRDPPLTAQIPAS